jgi:hypothetical protein
MEISDEDESQQFEVQASPQAQQQQSTGINNLNGLKIVSCL